MKIQLAYLASAIIFYAVLISYSLYPGAFISFLGSQAWQIHLMILTMSALVNVACFFMVAMTLPSRKRWQGTLYFDGVLVSIPLYFLWLTFLHVRGV